MSHSQECPRCKMSIANERKSDSVVICNSCGYVVSTNQFQAEKNVERHNLKLIVGISVAVLVVMSQLGSWGNYALEIRWLQFRDMTGTASVATYDRMAAICQDLKKLSCVEYALSRESKIEPKSSLKLAEFQLSRNKFKEAAKSLKSYVSTKQDAAAYLTYARALSASGQVDEATRYYEMLINSRAKKVPTEVTENYVRHLAKARRFEQAENVILKMRQRQGAPHLMETELRALNGMRESSASYKREIASVGPVSTTKR